MFYRQSGIRHTRYTQDRQLWPLPFDRALVAVVCALLVVAPFVLPGLYVSTYLMPWLLWTTAALGLNLLMGVAGQVHLGYGAVMAIGALAGGLIALRYGDVAYPAVIASCAGAMFVAQRASDPAFATAALCVCVVMLVVAGLGAAARARRPARNAEGGASRWRAKSAHGSVEENWYLTGPTTSIMRH